jgi:predicted transcriptional regulator
MFGGIAMNTLTIRIPDDLADRLKNTAQSRGISVNKLITEISVQALTAYDAETRFKLMATEADIHAALNVLDRLDKNG